MSAIISKCKKYRYRLERVVGPGTKTCLFIMLNPSTADAEIDDNTIRRCMKFTQSFGCDRLIVGNLFAFRTKKPSELKIAASPEGPHNLRHLETMCREAQIVVAAWGVHGEHLGQGERIKEKFQMWGTSVHCLQLTKNGHPRHPLYVKGDRKPQRWR